MSTPHGIYLLNSHLKDSILGFTHSAPSKNSCEGGGFRPKASEPLTNENLKISSSPFFVFGGDRQAGTESQHSWRIDVVDGSEDNYY